MDSGHWTLDTEHRTLLSTRKKKEMKINLIVSPSKRYVFVLWLRMFFVMFCVIKNKLCYFSPCSSFYLNGFRLKMGRLLALNPQSRQPQCVCVIFFSQTFKRECMHCYEHRIGISISL